ncbi:MAG: hypothetical protein F4X01_11115 [Nitrospira sp. SB0661_bin_20]|nr:hypothetical protein [Nitrospira sp. SB0661_bin_20]MYJ23458.1 hypothetical protein [Nitrospira sp. SB0673_bin_12]
MIMERPNLFSYATSELSQDAFICWLLEWSLPQYRQTDTKLHECAVNFIRKLFEKHGKQAPLINSVKEPLIKCDSGMQGKASRSETRSLSWR